MKRSFNCPKLLLHLELLVEEPGERLDAYLADQLEDISRSQLQKLIASGNVQLNGQRCESKKALLKLGDRLQLTLPDAAPLDDIEPEAIALDILYEDAHLLIINKPVDMVVHPSAGHTHGTLVNALLAHCQTPDGGTSLSGIGGVQRPGIVHRLDKDTTGAIAVAKTNQAHIHLQAQFQAKTAKREYLGVVYGAPKTESGTVNAPLGRSSGDRKKQAVLPEAQGGRPALTHWRLQERLGNFSLLAFALETGRTHQIRVHAAHMGHPIVGDPDYSSGRSIGVKLPGQALHAFRLTLIHPSSGETIQVEAPPPAHLTKLIEVLRRRNSPGG